MAETGLIRGALQLSSHILAKDPSQFASQIVGRLLPYQDQPKICQLFGINVTKRALARMAALIASLAFARPEQHPFRYVGRSLFLCSLRRTKP